jgi:hypothetical protein
MISIISLSNSKIDEKISYDIIDLGIALQQEIVTATEVEDGFIRVLNVPQTLQGRDFQIFIEKPLSTTHYMTITCSNHSENFVLPGFNGTLAKGVNLIQKNENIVYITQP